VYPRRSDYILRLRETVNRMIKERQDEISI